MPHFTPTRSVQEQEEMEGRVPRTEPGPHPSDHAAAHRGGTAVSIPSRATHVSRRGFLAIGGVVAVVAALPAATPVAEVIAPDWKVMRVPIPTWIVGTPGEWDHEIVRAWTREAAVRLRCDDCEGEDDEDFAGPDGCECEPCLSRGGYEATRVEAWDGRAMESIGSGDWLEIGNEARCERCHYETDPENGHSVAGKAVCLDCMTLADWEIVDPEHAAELRADLEDEPPASCDRSPPGPGPQGPVHEGAVPEGQTPSH